MAQTSVQRRFMFHRAWTPILKLYHLYKPFHWKKKEKLPWREKSYSFQSVASRSRWLRGNQRHTTLVRRRDVDSISRTIRTLWFFATAHGMDQSIMGSHVQLKGKAYNFHIPSLIPYRKDMKEMAIPSNQQASHGPLLLQGHCQMQVWLCHGLHLHTTTYYCKQQSKERHQIWLGT